MARFVRRSGLLAAVALLVALAACSDDDNPVNGGSDITGGNIQTNHTEPTALVAAQAEAMSAMDLDACLALMEAPSATHPGFRFRPSPADAGDLDFLAGRIWDHAFEVSVLANLFDPAYASTFNPPWKTIHSLRIDGEVLSTQEGMGGVFQVDCSWTLVVTFTDESALTIPTRLIFELVPVAGFLRIREVSEVATTRADELPSLPRAIDTWGYFKALFRGDARGPIDLELTGPEDVVRAHALATSDRNLEIYSALLLPAGAGGDAFTFCPKLADVGDLPWMEGRCWDHATEIGIMTNMFDPTYSSPEADPVQSIDMDVNVLAIEEPGGGTTVIDCTATVLVLVGPDDGFFTDTRFLFTLAPYGDGVRIQRIQEIDRYKAQGGGMRDGGGVGCQSWAGIKAVYRQRP